MCGSGWLMGAVRVLWSRVMVWSLWARSLSLVRSALGGGSDCRGPMVVRREDKSKYRVCNDLGGYHLSPG